jgi:hypothetical protein
MNGTIRLFRTLVLVKIGKNFGREKSREVRRALLLNRKEHTANNQRSCSKQKRESETHILSSPSCEIPKLFGELQHKRLAVRDEPLENRLRSKQRSYFP